MSPHDAARAFEPRAERGIAECFEEVVRARPHAPALAARGHRFTYQALNRAANRLAHAILARAGSQPRPLLLIAERDVWGVVGMLAILKAGHCCVPLHPGNHEDRALAALLAELRPPLVVAHGTGKSRITHVAPQMPLIDCERPEDGLAEHDPALPVSPDALAFVIYTSGSTGKPKGVMHNQRNILHRVFWYAQRFGVGAEDRTLMLSSADHISGTIGMLRPLLTGGALHVFSIRREGLRALADTLHEQRSTLLPMVNSVFRRFIDELDPRERFPDVRLLILGGEAPDPRDLECLRSHFSEHCLLLNTLGCTELPTFRYFVLAHDTVLPDGVVPAGHAVPGTAVMLVDAEGRPVDADAPGEIVVHSPYLALGYWNRPEETHLRFATGTDGVRSYRTGDLGRMRPDGTLQHLGRIDWQVKILGNRVEPGEVEAVLREHPGLRDAAVVARADADAGPRLCAYLVPRDTLPPAPSDIRTFLRGRLPDYMVPSELLFLAELPLTRSGKIDRRALPDARPMEPLTPRAPETLTDVEAQIAAICRSVLRRADIGLHEPLLDAGVNSLLAMQIAARLSRAFDLELPPTLVFTAGTVAELARQLEAHSGAPRLAPRPRRS